MKQVLNYLFEHKTLDRNEARSVLTNIAKGLYNHSQIASFISVYLMRNITIDELSGFRDALMDLCIPVDLSDYATIDLCGTGGDGKDTFNISTMASFVAAGAGAKVAKHGNYGVSSACGSSNLVQELGYHFSVDQQKLRKEIEETGLCFLHAPLFNPAMKNVAPVRKELGVKTFFNMLGPMVNPASPGKQLIGVYSLELARLYNYLYQETGRSYAIVHSLDGYDEVSLTGPFKLITGEGERIMNPTDLYMHKHKPEELAGGRSAEEAAAVFMQILNNKGTEAQVEVVTANAALGLKTYYPEKTLDECLELARESLKSGKALSVCQRLMELNNKYDR
jgi:anthranilate phosphoribosyltransferase